MMPERIERKANNGRVWSVHWECPRCHGKVDKLDAFCRTCGLHMLLSDVPPGTRAKSV